ncbi:hypothetical protein FHS43_004853 [Streptosporangium becharense]|uniref:Uncharacterized protein n=1 Tax=Streptosporangium becharense TaxID=1816182 RepID=A0A7W9II85_9ACTN|nr:hypothetical protein [Streptosporangium becharense]MBB2913549.1 hypothetical protein [Streptosporangium becharense]MBB5821239.1 hypothetical protein [Streptosporangium becharense]
MRTSLVTVLTGLVLVTGCTGCTDAANGKAVKLRTTDQIRTALGDTYWKYWADSIPGLARGEVDGPKGVHYGKITGVTRAEDVHWAIGSIRIKGHPDSDRGGPHVWNKAGGGPWKYRGDSDGCPAVPARLLKAWGQPRLICR